MLDNYDVLKYEAPYKGPFVITQCWKNGMVKVQFSATKMGILYTSLSHIHHIQTLKMLSFGN